MIYFNNKKIKNNKVNNNDRILHLNNYKQRKRSIFNEAIIWIRGSKDYDDYKKIVGNKQRLKKINKKIKNLCFLQ